MLAGLYLEGLLDVVKQKQSDNDAEHTIEFVANVNSPLCNLKSTIWNQNSGGELGHILTLSSGRVMLR